MGYFFTSILVLFTLHVACACHIKIVTTTTAPTSPPDPEPRPIYNIAHMVNSIGEIEWNLIRGANVLECDIQFYPDGSVKEVYHGFPCDAFRYCEFRANLKDYLEEVRALTDPSRPNNYADQMIMQFFDCKLSNEIDLEEAGRSLATHVINYLWDGERKQEVRALVYIDSVDYSDTIKSFVDEFKMRGLEHRLIDVGFDGGSGKIEDILQMFEDLEVVDNIWIGDGNTNYFNTIYPDDRLKAEIEERDNGTTIKKVYHWTIDLLPRMKNSLELGVDGFITNVPLMLQLLVEAPFYNNTYRLATPDDNPFERYTGE